jgi:delta-1-pyrroline-5-carboxylate synthetase
VPFDRSELTHAKRVLIKVGTAVVTRDDGRLALTRLGALVETIRALRAQERDVILVSSGAIGLGSSYLGLEAPTESRDCPVAAAAGQGLLMEKYRQLFGSLDLKCAQVLLTEDDFSNAHRHTNIVATLKRLLDLGVVPIVNENDAVTSAIKTEHKQGVFYDNDRLAGLTAAALNAELFLILSNVDGLYTAPPNAPEAQRIGRYDPSLNLRFGANSTLGRGGMKSKVLAATRAAAAGVPVVIASGLRIEAAQRVLSGHDEGTLFVPHTRP